MPRYTPQRTDRMSDLDFMLGTLNGAAEHEPWLRFTNRNHRVDAAFHHTYETLRTDIESGSVEDVDLRFVIAPDPVWGDSQTVQDMMAFLDELGYVVRVGNGVFTFERCFGRTPEEVYTSIPSGSPELFRRLGRVFLSKLNET